MFQYAGMLVISVLLFITSVMGYLSFKKDDPPSMKKNFIVGMMILSPVIIIASVIGMVRGFSNSRNQQSIEASPAPAPVPEPTVAKINNRNKVAN